MHVACLSHILVCSIFGIALLHGMPKVLHHVAEQCQTVNNFNEIKHTQPHVKGCLHAVLLAFESAIEAATQSQPKCKLCLHVINIAQKLQKSPPQGVADGSSDLQQQKSLQAVRQRLFFLFQW